MKAKTITADGLSYLRSACQRALEHWYGTGDRLNEDQRKQRGEAIGGELERALWSGPLIKMPHPAARQADVRKRLADGAAEFRRLSELEVRR